MVCDAPHLEGRGGGEEVVALGRDLAGVGVGLRALIAQHAAGDQREVRVVDRRAGHEGRGAEVGQDGHGMSSEMDRVAGAPGSAAPPRRRACGGSRLTGNPAGVTRKKARPFKALDDPSYGCRTWHRVFVIINTDKSSHGRSVKELLSSSKISPRDVVRYLELF